MNESKPDRRKFLKKTIGAAVGIAASTTLVSELSASPAILKRNTKGSIRFSVIGLNHGHIYSQTAAVIRGGGELVSFYAKERTSQMDLPNGIHRQKPQKVSKRSWKIHRYN
jgi:hypothetical protein